MSVPVKVTPDIQTIIWDFDGTLLDSFGIYRDCLNAVLRERGRPEVTEAVLRNNHHGHIEDSVANALRDMRQTVSTPELAEIMAAFYKLDNVYIEDTDHHLYADAVDLAERAHKAGKRQIVVTNRPHGTDRGNGSARNLIASSRLRECISDVLCGDDSAFRKPDRRVLEVKFGPDLKDLGKMVVVGDQFVDAEFGRSIGCEAILVTRADKIAHLDRLSDWETYVRITSSLLDVEV